MSLEPKRPPLWQSSLLYKAWMEHRSSCKHCAAWGYKIEAPCEEGGEIWNVWKMESILYHTGRSEL